jgi:TrmH family RNA methyltransferase
MPAIQKHMPVRIVQSRQNARVKEIRMALRKGGKGPSGLVALEGFHLIEEALRGHLPVPVLFVRSGSLDLLEKLDLPASTEVLELAPDVFASIATTESPQPVAALAQLPTFSLEAVLSKSPSLIVVLAGLQDPGNLGTIIRSAEAFGAAGVITLPGTANLWNTKVLRASAGSIFRIPVLSLKEDECLDVLRHHGVPLIAAVARGGTPAHKMDLSRPAALVIGNEGKGLHPEMLSACEARIKIPCPGPVESLNAAVAASILLYEAARQRGQRVPKQNLLPEDSI